jgi:uncharacterized heparinase superfamily protein
VGGRGGRRRIGPPLSMLPEIVLSLLRRSVAPLRVAWRRNWIYRQFLNGRLADRVEHQPVDTLAHRLEDADGLLKGRFRFVGQTVEARTISVFECTPPSEAWAQALHGFEWVGALAVAGGDAARHLATQLITEWLHRFSRYGEPAWLPEVTARRLLAIMAHGRFVLANSEILWRSKLFVSLRQQVAQLGRIASEAPEGLSRLEAAAIHVLARACFGDNPRRIESALAGLATELAQQILPDGGHVSRSPEDLLLAYRQIVMVIDALSAAGIDVPVWLRSAHDRAAPMLRFFRHADGALAVFNGGSEANPRMVEALLARDEVRGQPFLYAPHSGYQRLTAARSLAILDCGGPPPPSLSTHAHAGCLAFEFDAHGNRLVVNCGAEKDDGSRWDGALRTTAAHSTVTVADTSMLPILSAGLARDLLGPRLLSHPARIASDRRETPHGWRVDAAHEFYCPEFGIVHERMLTLSSHGNRLTGADRLSSHASRRKRAGIPFAIRFHIHPDVRVSPSLSGDILLKLPNGEGWRFRHAGSVSIEESVYAGHNGVRRAEQLVLTGQVGNEPVETAWVFEQIGTE